MVREEGHYTIKRVDALPKSGNANFLYVLKGATPVDTFYRWLPNGTYEEITVGQAGGGSGVTNTSELVNDGSDGTSTYVENDEIGTAATSDVGDFATTAQGALADSAVQPGDLATVATTGDYNDLINQPVVGTVASVVAGEGMSVDNTDAANPIVGLGGIIDQDVGITMNETPAEEESFTISGTNEQPGSFSVAITPNEFTARYLDGNSQGRLDVNNDFSRLSGNGTDFEGAIRADGNALEVSMTALDTNTSEDTYIRLRPDAVEIKTPAVDAATATVNQVLTLTNATTGEAEFQDAVVPEIANFSSAQVVTGILSGFTNLATILDAITPTTDDPFYLAEVDGDPYLIYDQDNDLFTLDVNARNKIVFINESGVRVDDALSAEDDSVSTSRYRVFPIDFGNIALGPDFVVGNTYRFSYFQTESTISRALTSPNLNTVFAPTATNGLIDAAGGTVLITKDWFNANVAGGGGGDLLAANNLSDVADAATSLANLNGVTLNTAQTITGSKTYSSSQTFNFITNFRSGFPQFERMDLFPHTPPGTTPTVNAYFGLDASNRLYWKNIGSSSIATFNSSAITADREYALPDAGGTIALTSDISGFGDFFADGSVAMTGTLNMNGNQIDTVTRLDWQDTADTNQQILSFFQNIDRGFGSERNFSFTRFGGGQSLNFNMDQNKWTFSQADLSSGQTGTGIATLDGDGAIQRGGAITESVEFSGPVINTIEALSSTANSTAWTGNEASLYSLTLTENTTLENPSTPQTGASYQFIITQDGTGGRTVSFGTLFAFPGGTAPTITAAANAKDVLTAIYDGTDLLVTSVQNFS